MLQLSRMRRAAIATILATGAVAFAAPPPARASVITDSPTLPLLNVPYVANSDFCFPAAGVCVSGANLVLTQPVSSFFDGAGQHITTDALQTATLTDLSHVPIGSVNLSGSIEQEVLGRTFPTELGSWTTDLVSLSLSGSVLGHTLTAILDPAHQSTGVTSITSTNGPNGQELFRIDSFFDVFVELTLDTVPPLNTTRGPIHVEAVQPVPEPTSIAAIATGLLIMLAMHRGRRTVFRWSRHTSARLNSVPIGASAIDCPAVERASCGSRILWFE